MSTIRYDDIRSIIKYLIDTKRYGPVDRMALAMGPESIEIALYDMLRLIDSLYGRSVVVKIKPTKKEKEKEREYILRCCEYYEDEKLGYGITGIVQEVLEGPEILKGKLIRCMPCPAKPSLEEIRDFLNKIHEDPSIARRVVLEAFSLHKGKEGA